MKLETRGRENTSLSVSLSSHSPSPIVIFLSSSPLLPTLSVTQIAVFNRQPSRCKLHFSWLSSKPMHSVPEKWIDENHEKQKNMRNPTYHERAKNTMNMSHGTLVVFSFLIVFSQFFIFSTLSFFHLLRCCFFRSLIPLLPLSLTSLPTTNTTCRRDDNHNNTITTSTRQQQHVEMCVCACADYRFPCMSSKRPRVGDTRTLGKHTRDTDNTTTTSIHPPTHSDVRGRLPAHVCPSIHLRGDKPVQ